MAKQGAFALVLLVIVIIGLLLYKKWMRSPNKERFTDTTTDTNTDVTNGNVYWMNGTHYSVITIDKPGNMYLAVHPSIGLNTIVMIAASTLNPCSQFLTNASGELQSILVPGTLYYLNIGEKRSDSTVVRSYYPNSVSASKLKLYGEIISMEFDNFNNIYITDAPGSGYPNKCAVIYMIASGNTTTSPFVSGNLTAGNIYIIAGKTNEPPSTSSTSATDGSVSRLDFKFSNRIIIKIDIYNNIYIADTILKKIFLIPSTSANPFPQLITGNLIPGNVYRLAGEDQTAGQNISFGDGGIASSAKFTELRTFTVDSSLNIYIVENNTIRMICGPDTRNSPFFCNNSANQKVNYDDSEQEILNSLIPGNIYRIAGTGAGANPGSGVRAISCKFSNIAQIVIDSQGNIYIADTSNALIRMISAKNRPVSEDLIIYPQTVGSARTTTPIDQFKKSYIYNIIGGGEFKQANNAKSGNPKKTYEVAINPTGLGIDIFGNYYFSQTQAGDYTNAGLFKVIINKFECPPPSLTGVTSCTSTSLDTPGFVICDGGYENTNGITCMPCSVGYYCPQISDTNGTPIGNLKIPCGAGTYNANTGSSNMSACLNCAAGSYSIGGKAICSVCSAGTYSSIPGSPACSSCPPNSTCYTGGTDATTTGLTLFRCSATRYAKDGACASCPDSSTCYPGGTDADRIGLTSFTCPVGYSNDGSNCIPCAPGYSNTGTACVPCPVGYYCSGTTNTPCGSNTANPNTGSSNAEACISCGAGFYSAEASSQCRACVANSASCSSDTSFICKPGYSNTGTACVPCPAGWTCSGTVNTPCGSNTANPNTGSSNVTACISCGSGFYSGLGSSQCAACVDNSVSCTSATSFICKPGYSNNGSGCVPCSSGYYCSGTSNTACPSGTANPNTGSSVATVCIICGTGYYSGEGSSQCTACVENSSSCISETSFTCARGYYSNADECSPCRENAYDCISPTSFRCAAGSYSNTGGCSYCPANSTCSAGGVDAGTIGLTSFTCKEGIIIKMVYVN